MRNTQEPEKRVEGHPNTLAVNSIFRTIQGEGPFAGKPAVFIRMAGCNLQCPLCDTEYTERVEYTAEALVSMVEHIAEGISLIVITGGEPFRQPIGHVSRLLVKAGFHVQVETNGTLFQSDFPWFNGGTTIVCSPKTGNVHREMLPAVVAWKYVATAASLEASEDGLPNTALDHPAHPRLYRPPAGHTGEVYLQPVDERNIQANIENQKAVVASCLKHGYRLCLQMHKIVGVP